MKLIFKFLGEYRLVHPISYVYSSTFLIFRKRKVFPRIAIGKELAYSSAAPTIQDPALLSFVPLMIFSASHFRVWESNLERRSGEYQLMLYKQLFLRIFFLSLARFVLFISFFRGG